MKPYTKENFIKNNYWNWKGFKVSWNVSGENNRYPIVFLHGFGASSKHWRNNINFFAKRDFAAYSLDLIGFGDSDQPGVREIGLLDNGVWGNQVGDFIEQIIKPKNSRKVILIGNSLGALVALTCAVSFENRISSVIASPLPDQIPKKRICKKGYPRLKKLKNRLIFIFFTFFPLEISLFIIKKLGIIKLGLFSAYFKKDNIYDELINLVK